MRNQAKLIGTMLFMLVLGVFLRPTSINAADAACVRLTMFDSMTLYHEYNPVSKTVKSVKLESGSFSNWHSVSANGETIAIGVIFTETQEQAIRITNIATQKSKDYLLENAYSVLGVLNSGWSPDNNFFAITVVSYSLEPEENRLLVFSKDGTLVQSIPHENPYGFETWAWSPQSTQIALLQTPPYENLYEKIDILSLDGTLIEASLEEPVMTSTSAAMQWSLDGRWIAVVGIPSLLMVDSTTGESVTVSSNPYITDMRIDVGWSPDSQYLIYTTIPDPSSPELVNVERYSILEQTSTILIEDILYLSSGLPAAPMPERGLLLVRQQEGETLRFLLVDSQTGEITTLLETGFSDEVWANHRWSPRGNVLVLNAQVPLFFHADTMETVFLPDGMWLETPVDALLWSENGEWVGAVVQTNDAGFAFEMINTLTGEMYGIPYPDSFEGNRIIPSNGGDALLTDYYSVEAVLSDGQRALLSENLISIREGYDTSGYTVELGAAWSDDGASVAFVEPSAAGAAYLLKVVGRDGALVSSVEIPAVMDSTETIRFIQWVPCV
jgi:hypothetical protein